MKYVTVLPLTTALPIVPSGCGLDSEASDPA
jgi:hypothetical protein